MKRKLFLAVLIASLALAGLGASSASASTGHVYLVVGNWHCVAGGTVTGVFGAVDDTWSGGDWGDNIVYPTVVFNRWDTFNARAYCNRPWYRGGGYWINVAYFQFHPTAWNQTFWY